MLAEPTDFLCCAYMNEHLNEILTCTPAGLYSPAGDFYIDPWRPVHKAIITHAHSDHARAGSQNYLAAKSSESLLRLRLGANIPLQTLPYNEQLRVGKALVSLHPAGHILGSAQVRIEVQGRIAVITGDYKLQADPTCEPWEPIPCHGLVTESTFGLPAFRWPKTQQVIDDILRWWQTNQSQKRTSILLGYSVGKSQRLIAELLLRGGVEIAENIAVHGALLGPNLAYRQAGVQIPELPSAASLPKEHDWSKSLVLAPPSCQGTAWLKRFKDPSLAMASGWMAIRGTRRRRGVERGFVLSDHVDWTDLLSAISAYDPSYVWVTHGFSEITARYLNERGTPNAQNSRNVVAEVLHTQFSGEESEPTLPAEAATEIEQTETH